MGLRILLSLTHVASVSDSCTGKSISLELGKHVFSQTKPCEIRRFVTLLRNYHPHRHVALALVAAVRGCEFHFLLQHYLY